MNTYGILRMGGSWDEIPAAPVDTVLWLPDAGIRASAKLAWDDNDLYVNLKAREKEIRAEQPADLLTGMPCEDSCLEFFFRPLETDPRYINIEFNPNGCMYLGIGHSGKELIRLLPAAAEHGFDPAPYFTADGWGITYRVPFSFVRFFFPSFAPAPGTVLYGNFFKCGDLTPAEHYLSWNPVTSSTPNFHRPQDFGKLIFESGPDQE